MHRVVARLGKEITMKRFIYASVTALALVAVLSTAALANCGSCGPEA